jgi:hypothetical protein
VIAQLTTTGDFNAAVNAQGRSTSGDDWTAKGIKFASSGAGAAPPMVINYEFYFGAVAPANARADAILDDGTGFAPNREQVPHPAHPAHPPHPHILYDVRIPEPPTASRA